MQTESNINDVQTGQFLNTLVYMGAGSGSELNTLLALQPQRLLLIEADPQLASALQARTATLKQIQVLNTAVSGHPGPAIFHRYNLPHAGSLHPASGLLELFPGLKTVGQLQMKSESPVTLLQPLQMVAEQENLLIIDLPGEELAVLQALQQAGQLHLFRQLQLHCGRQPLYEGSKPAARILQWLQGQGFDVLTEDNTQDPDRPNWTLQRNALHLHSRELEQQLQLAKQAGVEQEKLAADAHAMIEQLSLARDEQGKLASERQTQIERLTHERDEHDRVFRERLVHIERLTQTLDEQTQHLAEQQAQLAQATQANVAQERLAADAHAMIEQLSLARDEQIQLVQQRDLQLGHITRDHDEDARVLGERQAHIEQITKGYNEHARVSEQRLAHIEQLTRDIGEQTKLASDLQWQNQRLIQERDEKAKQLPERSEAFNGTLSELKTELTQARQTANLTTKLYALRSADLEDMQSRYKEAVNMQERQHQLMLQLEGKLRVAAQYFHQLQNSALSPVTIATETHPPATPVGGVSSPSKRLEKPGGHETVT